MLLLFVFLLTIFNLFQIKQCESPPSLLDPRVYNYYFYINTDAQLVQQQIYTRKQAQDHWQNVGVHQGLQACGSFHVLQFLDNYPDLKQKFGTNYTEAIYYYLTTGYDEHLMGYTEGGAYGRYTIAAIESFLYLSASKRMGCSIDSIVFKNNEYINSWDHTRDLQISISTDDNGPCYNPNEAGSKSDGQNATSTSIITNINSFNDTLITNTSPAFYLSSDQGCAINKVNVSNFNISKNVKINFGYQGIWWITYKYHVYIPQFVEHLIIQSPQMALNGFLDTFWWMDGDGGIYPVTINNDLGGNYTSNPKFNLIASSNDTNMAITMVASNMPQKELSYSIENYLGLTPDLASTVKLYATQHYTNISAGTTLVFETFICVGTVMDVQFCAGFAH